MKSAADGAAKAASRFIVGFGLVSMLMDVVYEGALSVQGPLLASLGASAAVVGLVSGLGEATSLAGRLLTGPMADRAGRYWTFAILGYAVTALAVPAMGLAGSAAAVGALVVVERFGKAMRTPSRDAMIAHASSVVGRGRGFALHEVLDQLGATLGPLVVSGVLFVSGGEYGRALGALLLPGAAAIAVLMILRRRYPDPSRFEHESPAAACTQEPACGSAASLRSPATCSRLRDLPRRFWGYSLFCGLSLAGIATFAVLSFHMVECGVEESFVPVVYALAMLFDGAAALISGLFYDRIGPRALIALPVLGAFMPVFAFSGNGAFMIMGAVLWGIAMGVQESTMRAFVADLLPAGIRATGFGCFALVTGVGTMLGGFVTGWLYGMGGGIAVIPFALAVQAVALILFLHQFCSSTVARR